MIAARLRHIAGQHPSAPALIFGGLELSYRDLIQAGSSAQRTLADRGVRPGDFVMVSLPVCIDAAVIFAACAGLSAIFFPVNLDWRKTELAWLLQQIPPAIVFVRAGDTERWLEAGLPPNRLAVAVPFDGPAADPLASAPDDIAAALISSGSMGQPKIVLREAGRVVNMAATTATACSVGPGSRIIATVPLHFSHGLSNNLTMPLLSGATIVTLERFDPHAAASLIERHSIEYLITSPAVFTLMVDANVPAASLQSLRMCLSSGAPLAPSVSESWKQRYGTLIRQAYGSSETGLMAIQDQHSPDRDYVGPPLPGTAIRILKDDADQPCGETGEIAVTGPGVLSRYWGDTPLRMWNGFLRTGDLGHMDAGGRLYVAGRALPWINTGGVKVDPVEVQRVIAAMPGVRECRVEPGPGPDGMEVVVAIIVPEPGTSLTRSAVIRHCRQSLAEFKLPRVIRFVPALASDVTGKSPKPWS